MPAYVTALVMKADAGAEFACRAHEKAFEHEDEDGRLRRRGIISYYATSTMAEATTFHSWLTLIEEKSRDDLLKQKIRPFHQPILQLCGDANRMIIGTPQPHK